MDRISFTLRDGIYNAGILGLIKLLEKNGVAHEIDGQDLFVEKTFFERNDLSELYLQMIFDEFEKLSRFNGIINTDFDNCHEKELKNFDGILKGATFKAPCELYGYTEFIQLAENYLKSKAEEKRASGNVIKEYLKNNQELYRYLVIADQTRVQLGDFFGTFGPIKISMGNKLISPEKKFEQAFDDTLFNSLREHIASNEYKQFGNKASCLSCRTLLASSKNFIDIKFLEGFVDDPAKKQSVFWNRKSDALICPFCAFVYAMIPFGFVLSSGYSGDKFFANNNLSIKLIIETNGAMGYDIVNKTKLTSLNAIICYEISQKSDFELNESIEFIVREHKEKRSYYRFDILGRDVLNTILKAKTKLENIQNTKIKMSEKDYLDVFNEVLNNILSHTNQWLLLKKLLHLDASSFVLNNIFDIQIIQKNSMEEKSLEEIKSLIKQARYSGKELKEYFGKESENKLRGFIYKLINTLSSGNRNDFLDSIVRMYSGIGKEIPYVFINMFDDSNFKDIGYAYLLGLKSGDKKDNPKNEGEEQQKENSKI